MPEIEKRSWNSFVKPVFRTALAGAALALTVSCTSRAEGVSKIAGCPGGPEGTPAAGTICPDGTVPNRDPNLPLGCPGSAMLGPIALGAKIACPERPGRAECTANADRLCFTPTGLEVSKGNSLARPTKVTS